MSGVFGWIGLACSILVALVLVSLAGDRPKQRDVEDLDAIFGGSALPEDTVPVLHPRPKHYKGNRRRRQGRRLVHLARPGRRRPRADHCRL